MSHEQIDQLNRLKKYTTNLNHLAHIDLAIKYDGKWTEASKASGINEATLRSTIKRLEIRASTLGDSPSGNLLHPVPAGFAIKRISTFTNKDGDVGEWVIKERSEEDKLNAMREAVENMCSMAESKYKQKSIIPHTESNLLATYVIGDQHYGLLSWHGEVGEDYDLKISDDLLRKATNSLVASTPNTKEALILNTGDFFHDNTGKNATPKSGHALDVDGRFAKIIQTGFMLMVAIIETALTKHEIVYVRNALGNHSFTAELMMSEFLSAWFRNEDRVIIHKEPTAFFYKQFGKVLLGITHGDTVKPTALGELMATDCETIWSSTKHRYWLLGHVHSKHVTEMRSCTVESFNTLAAKDVWHTESGYRSKRNMTAIIYHRDHGEVQRHTVDIGAL